MMAAMDLAKTERVLIIKPSSLGDIVHTLPVVQALAAQNPHWQIDWVANTPWLPLLQEHSRLRRIIEFPRREFRGHRAAKFVAWVQALRREGRYQLALDFQGLQRSALIAKFALEQRSSQVWGVSPAREAAAIWYHKQAPRVGEFEHALARYHALGTLAGLELNLQDLPPAQLPQGGCPAGAEALVEGQFWILHPYSRGAGKALELALQRQLLEGMLELEKLAGQQLVLVGQASEDERVQELPEGVLDLTNQTSLPELCWLLRRAAGVISVDSGPMHLAAAFAVPLLGLHSWSEPHLVGPWRPANLPPAWVFKAGELSAFGEFSKAQRQVVATQKNSTFDETVVEAALAWVSQHS